MKSTLHAEAFNSSTNEMQQSVSGVMSYINKYLWEVSLDLSKLMTAGLIMPTQGPERM